MKSEQSAYNVFLETGKIDDYLAYCQKRKQEMLSTTAGGKGAFNAIDNQRSGPAGLPDWRG